MTDYFALFGEARRPWLEADELKEKYFARVRATPADAEVNEGFRVLSDPKLRLQHFLVLQGAEVSARREIPAELAEMFWNTGALLREVDRWQLKNSGASSALARALLGGERVKLAQNLRDQQEILRNSYERVLDQLRHHASAPDKSPDEPPNESISDPPNELTYGSPDELAHLLEFHDALAYLTRLREQVAEKLLGFES